MGKMFVATHKNWSLKLPFNYYYYYVGEISNSHDLENYVYRDNIYTKKFLPRILIIAN